MDADAGCRPGGRVRLHGIGLGAPAREARLHGVGARRGHPAALKSCTIAGVRRRAPERSHTSQGSESTNSRYEGDHPRFGTVNSRRDSLCPASRMRDWRFFTVKWTPTRPFYRERFLMDAAAARCFLFNILDGRQEARHDLGIGDPAYGRIAEFCLERSKLLENQISGRETIGRCCRHCPRQCGANPFQGQHASFQVGNLVLLIHDILLVVGRAPGRWHGRGLVLRLADRAERASQAIALERPCRALMPSAVERPKA